jgi:hypothetical protein
LASRPTTSLISTNIFRHCFWSKIDVVATRNFVTKSELCISVPSEQPVDAGGPNYGSDSYFPVPLFVVDLMVELLCCANKHP